MNFTESETSELKKSTSEIKEAMVSIVSILNKHQHGELFFGIKNHGVVIGQNVTEKTIRECDPNPLQITLNLKSILK